MASNYLIIALILTVLAGMGLVIVFFLRKKEKHDEGGPINVLQGKELLQRPSHNDHENTSSREDKTEQDGQAREVIQSISLVNIGVTLPEIEGPKQKKEPDERGKEQNKIETDVHSAGGAPQDLQINSDVSGVKKSRKVEPGKSGGRPRGTLSDHEKAEKISKEAHHVKPEIVCWQREGQWMLGVEIPGDLSGKSSIRVLQNGELLAQAENVDCWLLGHTGGDVQILWRETELQQETTIELGRKDFLLFKLSGDQNRGRIVKYPSSGWYLVVVPHHWERDISLSGLPPVSPEPVSITGYQGHFFVLTGNTGESICFQAPGRKPAIIRPKKLQVELSGDRLDDAEDMTVPLFGTMPPRICALNGEIWHDVKTIILGEEGPGRGRWRTEFQPEVERLEQKMPAELMARKGGWYFLRFYDTNDNLIDSLDFKFLSGLKAIEKKLSSALPSVDGHEIAVVNFIHDPDCVVQPLENASHVETIKRNDNSTLISLPASPAYDETYWLIRSINGPQIEVAIILERIWWGIGTEELVPSEWTDRIIDLSRTDFYATSETVLWLKSLKRGWSDNVLIGFDEQRARKTSVRVNESAFAMPLREFVDSPEVDDRRSEFFLKIYKGSQSCDVALLPKAKFRCAQPSCDFVTMDSKAMAEHVKIEHIQLFIKPLNYNL